MGCTICGKTVLPGALLCRPCRAALKRARHATVQEAPPPSTAQQLARRGRTPRSVAPAAPRRLLPPSDRGHVLVGGIAIVVLLVSAAYVGRHGFAPAGRADGSLAPQAAVVVPVGVDVPTIDDVRAAPPAEVAPAAEPERIYRVPVAVAASPSPAATSARTERAQAAARARAEALAPALPTTAAAFELFALGTDAPRAPPPPAPAPAVRPPPDRWQAVNEALARCDSEGGISGFICDQRVRLAACDGYWGRMPQCPAPPENPR